MWLARCGFPTKIKRWLPVISIAGLALAYFLSSRDITQGVDPLFALKTTRITILAWIIPSVSTLILFTQSRYWHHLPQIFQTILSWMGRHSYLIFLSHTILLRMIFAFFEGTVGLVSLGQVFASWIICVAVSLKLKE